MRNRLMLAALAGAAILSPAIAQTANPAAPTQELPYDRGYDKPTARADAVNAQEAPVTDSLNAQADVSATVKTNNAAANQAQYELDRQAYIDALVKHDTAVDRTAARYVRQQRAYADAMAVWRVQVQQCKQGHQRACDPPPPSVADYY
ncbi:hypothetical protein HL653_18040 [Sphingomonas sp. AP4-R1]|uniref:hypothetical protein n=1 Tax=Sphingomonas sp. AP4-R1 TaxID=2735134 RepID=UPI001493A379|nr:hypothetical protein [Sphingomonas sp. AP4-R1]QJU59404.1 hypothetical protein HL653_18040 [Sphingomonas sp. AP4-R1]